MSASCRLLMKAGTRGAPWFQHAQGQSTPEPAKTLTALAKSPRLRSTNISSFSKAPRATGRKLVSTRSVPSGLQPEAGEDPGTELTTCTGRQQRQ